MQQAMATAPTHLTQNVPADPTAFGGGAIMGRLVDGLLDTEDDNYSPADGQTRTDVRRQCWRILADW